MTMTVVVTRDVSPRVRGFLASVLLEVAPGVYTSPRLSAAVRDRVWKVLVDWHGADPRGSALMTWPASSAPAGQEVLTLGLPHRLLVRSGEVVLSLRRAYDPAEDPC